VLVLCVAGLDNLLLRVSLAKTERHVTCTLLSCFCWCTSTRVDVCMCMRGSFIRWSKWIVGSGWATCFCVAFGLLGSTWALLQPPPCVELRDGHRKAGRATPHVHSNRRYNGSRYTMSGTPPAIIAVSAAREEAVNSTGRLGSTTFFSQRDCWQMSCWQMSLGCAESLQLAIKA